MPPILIRSFLIPVLARGEWIGSMAAGSSREPMLAYVVGLLIFLQPPEHTSLLAPQLIGRP